MVFLVLCTSSLLCSHFINDGAFESYLLFCLFVVANLAEKQKRLQEVESIKEDASANYVRFTKHVQGGRSLFVSCAIN